MWAIACTEGVRLEAGDIRLLSRSAADRLDLGNYRKSELLTLALAAIAAREHGDDGIAEAALRRVDETGEPVREGGVLRYNASTYTNAHLALANLMRRGDWRATITQGPPAGSLAGPVLVGAKYPDVLVARAISDGEDLSLVLYPGAAQGVVSVRIERLLPAGRYLIESDHPGTVSADATGALELQINLQGRTPIRIVPRP
jgi:hypothetical protein